MMNLSVNLNGEGAWPDLETREFVNAEVGSMELAVLANGMSSGRPSVALRFDLPDGQVFVAQTSARLLCTAAKAIMAKYPDLFEGD